MTNVYKTRVGAAFFSEKVLLFLIEWQCGGEEKARKGGERSKEAFYSVRSQIEIKNLLSTMGQQRVRMPWIVS